MLDLKDISVSFAGENIISCLSFNVKKGEKAIIRGVSGKGKSTVLNLILGFVYPDSGGIIVDNEVLSEETITSIRSKIAWVPQEFVSDINVKEFIEIPFTYKRNQNQKPGNSDIAKLLQVFNLEESIFKKTMHEISGGEKQRIALVSTLLLNRPVLLLDEVVSALDDEVKQKVIDHIFSIDDQTVLSTSHDLSWIERCDKVIEL